MASIRNLMPVKRGVRAGEKLDQETPRERQTLAE